MRNILIFFLIIFFTGFISCKKEFKDNVAPRDNENLISVTKHQADSLISINALIKGSFYAITGTDTALYNDGTSSGTTVILQAIENNKFSGEGEGIFYNPKYNQKIDGYGLWDNFSSWTVTVTSGTFNGNELITSNNGATGQLFATISSNYFIALTGNWAAATSITGKTTGATATVSSVMVKAYALGAKVIWGGYSWTNTTAKVGKEVDVINLDSNWKKDAYDTTNYNISVDEITNDYDNDWISRRYEKKGNNEVVWTKADYNAIVHSQYYPSPNYSAIASFQWGNPFNNDGPTPDTDGATFIGVGSNRVIDSYFECVNFRGLFIRSNTLTETSFIYGNVWGYRTSMNQNSFSTRSGFYNNIFNYNGSLSGNALNVDSRIYNNILSNNAVIVNNTLNSGSLIFNNTASYNGCFIVYNTLNNQSTIDNNTIHNGSVINNNILNNSSKFNYNILDSSSYIGYNSLAQSSIFKYNNLYNSNIQDNSFNLVSYINIGMANKITGGKTIRFITAEHGAINVDVRSATIIYSTYPKTLYSLPDGTNKLRYFDNNGILVIANVTD